MSPKKTGQSEAFPLRVFGLGLRAGRGKWAFLRYWWKGECAGLWAEAQGRAKPFHKRKEAMRGGPGESQDQASRMGGLSTPRAAWGGSEENRRDPLTRDREEGLAEVGTAEKDRAEESAVGRAGGVNARCSVFSTKYSVESTLLTNDGEREIGMGQRQRLHRAQRTWRQYLPELTR